MGTRRVFAFAGAILVLCVIASGCSSPSSSQSSAFSKPAQSQIGSNAVPSQPSPAFAALQGDAAEEWPNEVYYTSSNYQAKQGEVVIPGVPNYVWHHGCAPTAVGMIIGYYDGQGYGDLIPGEASLQTVAVNQTIASDGSVRNYQHFEDYCIPFDADATEPIPDQSQLAPPSQRHPDNSIADFMQTSWSKNKLTYGASLFEMIGIGFADFVKSRYSSLHPTFRYYDLEANLDFINPYSLEVWNNVKSEIDHGRPLVFCLKNRASGEGHAVPVFGYREQNGYPEYLFWLNALDSFNTPPLWFPFFPQGDYLVGAVVVFSMDSPQFLEIANPVGGQGFPMGTPVSIGWNSKGLTGTTKIEINALFGNPFLWETIASGIPVEAGSYQWGALVPPGKYRLRITSELDSSVMDITRDSIVITEPIARPTTPTSTVLVIEYHYSGTPIIPPQPNTGSWPSPGGGGPLW